MQHSVLCSSKEIRFSPFGLISKGNEDVHLASIPILTHAPFRAVWESEPIMKNNVYPAKTFILSWYNGSDVFLPPWVLHDPLHEDYFIWSEDVVRYSWKEKTEMGNVALFVATNGGKDGSRGNYVQYLMNYIKVDSTGSFMHNAEVSLFLS